MSCQYNMIVMKEWAMVQDLDSESPLNVREAARNLPLRKLQALSGLDPKAMAVAGKGKTIQHK